MHYNVVQRGVIVVSITLRMSDADAELIRNYASLKGVTVSEVIRRAVMEKIEDEIDLAAYNRALEAFKKNPVTYTQDEVEKMLGMQ